MRSLALLRLLAAPIETLLRSYYVGLFLQRLGLFRSAPVNYVDAAA